MFRSRKIALNVFLLFAVSLLAFPFAFPNFAFANYQIGGTVDSKDMLPASGAGMINSFIYTASSIPAGTSVKVNFSYDGWSWFNSSGTQDGWNTLSSGTHTIDLSSLGWQRKAHFFYKLWLVSDGSATPVVESVGVSFTAFDGAYHVYPANGTLTSADLLSNTAVTGLNSFSYNVSSLPANTGITVQFSQNASAWYSSAGVLDASNTLSSGSNTISLSGLGWTGPHFYYKMTFTSSNGVSTPILDSVSFTYVVGEYFIGYSSQNYKLVSDSVNAGGGENSLSESYLLSDTVGEVGTGDSGSENYNIKAGYRQMQDVYISISAGPDISLSSMNGLTGGASNGEGGWSVMTDDPAGYALYIRAGTLPALKGNEASFVDYLPGSADPDYEFAISASSAAFGFTPEGPDIVQRFKDNGASCNMGTFDTGEACWDGMSMTDKTISQTATANHPVGATTTVKFRAQSGSAHIQENDSYSAAVTVTAIAL